MKKIFIITGRTGAGKSTLCNQLQEYFKYPLLSFAIMGKKFANANGYNRIRECYLAMELKEFKTKILQYILNVIKEELSECDAIIMDGIYIDDVVKKLKEDYICKLIYLKTDDDTRFKRISDRLSITIEQAKKENEIKKQLKNEVGINELIELADYVIDGNQSKEKIFKNTKQFISNMR